MPVLQQEAAVVEGAAQEPSSTVAEMQRLAEEALGGNYIPPLGHVSASRLVPLRTLQDIKAAVDGAAKTLGAFTNYNRSLGFVAAVILKHEKAGTEDLPFFEYAGKRIAQKVKALKDKVDSAKEAHRHARRNATKRNQGSAADLEAKLEELEQQLSAKIAKICDRETDSPLDSSAPATSPPSLPADGSPEAPALPILEGPRATPSMQVAAASLASLRGEPGEPEAARPSSRSCAWCLDLLREKAKAQEEAEQAKQDPRDSPLNTCVRRRISRRRRPGSCCVSASMSSWRSMLESSSGAKALTCGSSRGSSLRTREL